jgi:Holliday junction resolvase
MTEAQLQRQILDYLRALGCVVFQTHTGRYRPAVKGIPDIVGCTRSGRMVAVECKAGKGEPTDKQWEMIEALQKAGAVALVAWRVEDIEREAGGEL